MIFLLQINIELKDTIATINVVDFSASSIPKPLSKASIGHDSFTSTERNSTFNPDSISCWIVEDGSTMKSIVITFSSINC